jgi:hypothetical protein
MQFIKFIQGDTPDPHPLRLKVEARNLASFKEASQRPLEVLSAHPLAELCPEPLSLNLKVQGLAQGDPVP